MKVSDADRTCANWLCMKLPMAMIGGSFIVDMLGANDIDVFVPYSVFIEQRSAVLYEHPEYRYQFRETTTENEDYANDDCIMNTYRNGNVNLIVVADEFYSAYRQAACIMSNKPSKWKGDDKKQARAELHENLRNEIRGWMEKYK